MQRKTRVTMQDVARAAAVTPQTVSRAFRNAPDISAETREKVLKIAGELNYVMNNAAGSLRSGQNKLIVVVYDNLVNVYFSIMIDYLQICLRERGYAVLALSVRQARLDRDAYCFAVSHNAAGIITFIEPDEEIGELVKSLELPVLLVGRRTKIANVDYLRTDDEAGGELAAAYLAEAGAEKLAYITVDTSVSCAYDRYKGFQRELLRRGLGEPVVVEAYSAPLEERLLEFFKDADKAPDGIFCFNDMLAFDTLYVLKKNGLPRVRIVGYDCVQQELHIPNKITSVGSDKRAIAERAANIIMSRVEQRDLPVVNETFRVYLYNGTDRVTRL